MKKKALLLWLAEILGSIWRVIPDSVRLMFITSLLVVDSRGNTRKGLKQLLRIKDKLDLIINERATFYGQGIHPKHRLTNYHDFFTNRINKGAKVLDVGCGCGAVTLSIARKLPTCSVTGVDNDQNRLMQANSGDLPGNIKFIEGDATQDLPSGTWDVVVLSNVLEHISDRIGFLLDLKAATKASNFLIRVPLFERDWQMSLREELGVNFLSDPDHKIEHKLDEFHSEVEAAGLETIELNTIWGEIWANCQPKVAKDD